MPAAVHQVGAGGEGCWQFENPAGRPFFHGVELILPRLGLDARNRLAVRVINHRLDFVDAAHFHFQGLSFRFFDHRQRHRPEVALPYERRGRDLVAGGLFVFGDGVHGIGHATERVSIG